MADLTEAGEGYSAKVGLIYVFNLIVGTGALTLPAAFHDAGWLLSVIALTALAFMSFLTATFVIESIAAANAVRAWNNTPYQTLSVAEEMLAKTSDTDEPDDAQEDEKLPLLLNKNFNLNERIEMGKMATLFFNRRIKFCNIANPICLNLTGNQIVGVHLFYICIAIYLYGDLAIYAAAISRSLRDVTCTSNYSNAENMTDLCWPTSSVTREGSYRIYLLAVLGVLGPFAFFNVQKTKYLQLLTSLLRWLAFTSMIVLASIALANGKGQGHPKAIDVAGIPSLFGVCVYSFMCHHSLPSLVSPIKDKSRLNSLLGGDYLLILIFYCLLAFTGIYTFNEVNDIYTLNFQPLKGGQSEDIVPSIPFFEYFLSLFPVFTLSTSFPIIAITLRNNLQTLFLSENKHYNFFVRRMLFPIVTVIPPIVIAFLTENLEFLVGVTGSYAGAGIQYVVPALLVYCARKEVINTMGTGVRNKFTSPFRHPAWIIFVLIWAATCIIFVTVNHIVTGK